MNEKSSEPQIPESGQEAAWSLSDFAQNDIG
jgi:hypothetical protein